VARIAAAGVALASVTALAVAGVAERASVADSFTVLGHLHWLWIPAALLLESASMAAFAIMLRRLLAAGGASVGIRPMLATAYAANAVSVSVPLAGPAIATAFTFRRFTRQGADAPLAGWSLLAGGVISSAAAVLVVVGGGLASGNILVTAVTVLAVAILVAAVVAVRRPRLRDALERLAGWMLRQGSRMLRRPPADPGRTVRAWAQRLGSLQLPPSGWITATGLALANWLADAAVLTVSIRATGATVPWHDLLLVYSSGIAAQSLNITPGGLGVTEGSLSLALVATGLGTGQALAAVLLYRLASFWLVALAGWLIVFWLRRPRPHCGPGPSWRVAQEQHTAMTADLRTTDTPAGLGAHELVLLHGQPGSPADWQLVVGRLPAQLHAVATDRPGYGSSRLPAGGFAVNARAVLDDLDSHGIARAVLVGHSYGGGVALSAASLAPGRVAGVVLLASVGPGCVTGWDRLLAAPGAGRLCAQVAWRLTPWLARARLAGIARRRGRPLYPDEHVNWQVWGHAGHGHRPLWRTFLTEQRALLRELDELERAIASVRAPVLVLADPNDAVIPFETALRLTRALPDAHLQLVEGVGHHLPRRAPAVVADAIVAFLATAQITGGPDRSASRDMNSSRVLSVLVGRARRGWRR
jgi:pimeloyl-ACP methyl ester carboxylesterase